MYRRLRIKTQGILHRSETKPCCSKIGDTEYREMDFYYGSKGLSYEERFLNADGTPADYVSSSDSIVSDTKDLESPFGLFCDTGPEVAESGRVPARLADVAGVDGQSLDTDAALEILLRHPEVERLI